MIPARRRVWLRVALACLAMLVLPLVTLFLFPRRAPPALPPAPAPLARAATPEAAPSFAPRDAPAPAHAPRPAAMTPSATEPVKGVVLDPDGHPVKGSMVSCAAHDPPLVATSDDEGRFELPADAAGCQATAAHAEFFPTERVALAAGNGNTLRLARGGRIEGEAVDEGGAPLAAYMLGIESYQGPLPARAPRGQSRAIKDARGAFAWDGLAPGRYLLTATTDGRPAARSESIEVEAGRTAAHVRITVARGGRLAGRVIDAVTKRPVAGALVGLDGTTTTTASAVAPARTDDQGAYVLDAAPPGPFSVRVLREGYRPRVIGGLTTHGAAPTHEDFELNPIVDGGPSGEDFVGIGAFLEPGSDGVAFARLVPDGPAEKAGLHAGDVIRRIDGRDASSLAVVDCMQSLRGKDGSRVTVQVDRSGQSVEVTILRRSLTL